MKATKRPFPATPKQPRPKNIQALEKDALQVFCRLRPATSNVCIRMVSSTTICAIPPDLAAGVTPSRHAATKASQYMFKQIFSAESTQQQVFETVAQPLLEGLIQGRNGLLFAYGVTGSGKTYTMTGSKKQGGIMPRCIQILFKTIGNHQTEKYIFKPDKLNGFEMQTDDDANFDRMESLRKQRLAKNFVSSSTESLASLSESEVYPLVGFDPEKIYSVFITFVEIYNNGVYDLLDDGNQQVKIIREDCMRNMYVHGVIEVEVKSPGEALALFQKGRRRKRTAATELNAESSRSHSVFTIRLVQTQLSGGSSTTLTISQLSLVDLAGSERSNRTKNTGARLREASKINNSLLNLRTCLEVLRENYINGGTRLVPYRDSKLTHLFKMFFEGGGYVRMMVCVNPNENDYEETLQVLKFAEISQEVQITKPTPIRLDVERIERAERYPNKRPECETPKVSAKVSKITDRKRFRQYLTPIAPEVVLDPIPMETEIVDHGLVYNLGDISRSLSVFSSFAVAQQSLGSLRLFLEQRQGKREKLLADLKNRQNNFRKTCNDYDLDRLTHQSETNAYKAMLEQKQDQIENLESVIVKLEKERDEVLAKFEMKTEQSYKLQCDLNEKKLQVQTALLEKEQQKRKFDNKLMKTHEKMYSEFELKLREQREKLKSKMKEKDAKICKMVLDDDLSSLDDVRENLDPRESYALSGGPSSSKMTSNGQFNYLENRVRGTENGVSSVTPGRRHRRSRSVGTPGDKWLEHRAGLVTELPTAFKPQINRTKTLTHLGDKKDLTKAVNKYCLLTQEPDTDGEIETKLLKGDIIPTTGGGAQVVFNEMEVLRQESPTYHRKRSYPTTPSAELTARCSVGIEGHNNSSNKRNKN